jgi:single stranded DNA-binding protein
MADINKIMVTGRTGSDAEMKTVGETLLCKFSLAVAGWKKGSGETTTWIDVDVWGNRAKVGEYIRKGMKLAVTGRLVINKKDDGKVFVSINADDVILPDRGDNAKSESYTAPAQRGDDDDGLPF